MPGPLAAMAAVSGTLGTRVGSLAMIQQAGRVPGAPSNLARAGSTAATIVNVQQDVAGIGAQFESTAAQLEAFGRVLNADATPSLKAVSEATGDWGQNLRNIGINLEVGFAHQIQAAKAQLDTFTNAQIDGADVTWEFEKRIDAIIEKWKATREPLEDTRKDFTDTVSDYEGMLDGIMAVSDDPVKARILSIFQEPLVDVRKEFTDTHSDYMGMLDTIKEADPPDFSKVTIAWNKILKDMGTGALTTKDEIKRIFGDIDIAVGNTIYNVNQLIGRLDALFAEREIPPHMKPGFDPIDPGNPTGGGRPPLPGGRELPPPEEPHPGTGGGASGGRGEGVLPGPRGIPQTQREWIQERAPVTPPKYAPWSAQPEIQRDPGYSDPRLAP